MSLIPSPSPTRTSAGHSRKDKYGALTDESHRRTASLRSVSTNADSKSIMEKKPHMETARAIVPPRTRSQSTIQTAPSTSRERQFATTNTHTAIPPRTTSQARFTVHELEVTDDQPPTEIPIPSKQNLLPQKPFQELSLSLPPKNPPPQKESTSSDVLNSRTAVHKMQSSRELLQSLTRSSTPRSTVRPESQIASTAPYVPPRTTSHRRLPSKDIHPTSRTHDNAKSVTANSSTPPRNTVHKKQSSRDLRTSSRLQSHSKPNNTLKAKSSRDLAPRSSREALGKPNAPRKQLSKEFSPSPSAQSSPTAKMKSSSTIFYDSAPEQIRLLQLLHLIPLSSANLHTYESTAHKTLSSRYTALQSRFQAIQKLDHAQCLVDTLTTLKTWSDGQIRTLATLLIDWESLSTDLKNFNKRLSATLKPINKSVIEEKGPPTTKRKLTIDRLFSRLHDLEVVLVTLPATGGVPGAVVEELRTNFPVLRREVEEGIVVAGLRWRFEVLQTEAKRMDVVKRMSLGKPGREEGVICAWRE